MARTKRSASLDTRNKRLELEVGHEHTDTLAQGCYIIYRRPAGKGGIWRARWYDPATRKMDRTTLGAADDYVDADGIRVLTWEQASKKAGQWFEQRSHLAHLKATGEVVSTKPLTVGDAIAHYLEDKKRRGRPAASDESFCKSRIIPELGEIEVGALTKRRLEIWLQGIAESRRLRTGKGMAGRTLTEEEAKEASPLTPDQVRARKVTANRILTILKRALNKAVEDRRYIGITRPWRDVKPFGGVDVSRVRFLSQDEQTILLNSCDPDFRKLVLAALYTGSRYSPLCRMKVGDFNPEAGAIWIARDKGKDKDTSRWVILGSKAAAWFSAITAGRAADEFMFLRDGEIKRTSRAASGNQWLPYDQRGHMERACAAAKIRPLVFHELRHTYASWLINQGVSLSYVARQLGHANTRMVEKYYGHLCPSALAEAIRKVPELDYPVERVERLKVSG